MLSLDVNNGTTSLLEPSLEPWLALGYLISAWVLLLSQCCRKAIIQYCNMTHLSRVCWSYITCITNSHCVIGFSVLYVVRFFCCKATFHDWEEEYECGFLGNDPYSLHGERLKDWEYILSLAAHWRSGLCRWRCIILFEVIRKPNSVGVSQTTFTQNSCQKYVIMLYIVFSFWLWCNFLFASWTKKKRWCCLDPWL